MTVHLVPGIFAAGGQLLDQNGVPASGALVYTYAAGTVSAVPTFTTVGGNITAANPIVCDSQGRLPHEMWQPEGIAIKIFVTDSIGNTIGTYDDLPGINDATNISGIAVLSANNIWTGQNTFSNVTANNILALSVNTSSLKVSTISANAISVSSITVSTITVSGSTLLNGTVTVNATLSGTIVVPFNSILRREVNNGFSSPTTVTVVTATTTLVSVDLQTVRAGDKIVIFANVNGTKSGITGSGKFSVSSTNPFGTAQIAFLGYPGSVFSVSQSRIDETIESVSSGTVIQKNIATIATVIVPGTCSFNLHGTCSGGTILYTDVTMYAAVLNGYGTAS